MEAEEAVVVGMGREDRGGVRGLTMPKSLCWWLGGLCLVSSEEESHGYLFGRLGELLRLPETVVGGLMGLLMGVPSGLSSGEYALRGL